MFRKFNNKTLLVIFAILAVLVVVVLLYDHKKGERTFKSELFTIDSSAVSSIVIYPKGKGNDFVTLSKTGKEWEIVSKNKKYPADSSYIKNILHSLAHIVPERVSGTDRSSWKEFDMTDSLSTRVVVQQGQKTTGDFRVGKISFSRGSGRQGYGNRQNMDVKSHIRVPDDDRVYVVDGFLSMMFRANADDYRIRTLLNLDKSKISKLTFIYPGDSSFILSRKDNKWFVNDLPADSAETVKYLSSVANASGSEFADESAIFPNFAYTLKIEGDNMPTTEVKGATDEPAKKYYLKSTLNPSALFGGPATSNLFNQLFPGKTKFITQPKKAKKKK
jgi:signal peptidase I